MCSNEIALDTRRKTGYRENTRDDGDESDVKNSKDKFNEEYDKHPRQIHLYNQISRSVACV